MLLNSYQDDGPGNLILSVVRDLLGKGDMQFWTVAISRGGPLKSVYEEMMISTKVIGMHGYFDPKALMALSSIIKAGKFDIIHTNLIRADIIGRLLGNYAKIPIIITTEHGIHTWQVKGKFIEKLIKRAYCYTCKFTNKVIAVSEFVKNELIKNSVPENKIIRIYNGVDADIFKPLSRDEKLKMHKYLSDLEFENLIGVVGNLVSIKGHSFFIDAIPEILLQHPSSMVVFIGEGPLREELEDKVSQMGLSGKVKFLGQLSSILPKMIASMDVFVQPSLTESFGLAVAEAQACAVPVVASRTGGIPEIVINGKTGFLVDPGNSSQIAEKVCFILSDPKKCLDMGIEGRRFVVENFNISQTSSSYYKLYCELFYSENVKEPEPEHDVDQPIKNDEKIKATSDENKQSANSDSTPE